MTRLRALPEAPDVECLAEVSRLVREAVVFCHIVQTPNSDRRIDDEAFQGNYRTAQAPLEDIVPEDQRLVQVGEEAAHGGSSHVRNRAPVGLRRGLPKNLVQETVEIKNPAIQGLEPRRPGCPQRSAPHRPFGPGTVPRDRGCPAIEPCLLAKVAVLTTVTSTNAARLLETARYMRDLGIKHWDTTLFQPLGRATQMPHFAPDTDVVIQSYFELFDAVEAGEFDQMTVARGSRYLRNVLSGERRSMCLRDGCGAARDLVSISVDGTIESCDCIGDRTLSLGHMDREGISAALDSPIADTIRGRSTASLSPCQNCDWRSFCGGTCLARSGLERIDEVECQISLALFPEIFRRLANSDRLERIASSFASPVSDVRTTTRPA